MTTPLPDCYDILIERNITWQQYFIENGVVLHPVIRRRVKRYEKQGYIASGFAFGFDGVHVMFMEHKDNKVEGEGLSKMVDLHFCGNRCLPDML
jgi:hypothetical protein